MFEAISLILVLSSINPILSASLNCLSNSFFIFLVVVNLPVLKLNSLSSFPVKALSILLKYAGITSTNAFLDSPSQSTLPFS